MKPFQAPLEDILFSLNHVACATDLTTWDPELGAEIAGHFASFAEGEIAPIDERGDQEGCQLRQDRVYMPEGFREVYQAYADQGWAALSVPEAFGGQDMDGPMLAITSEIFSGANHSLQMVAGLVPGAVRTLLRFGTEAQQARWIPPLASGETLATMCLTEPGAGSDLSQVRCRATQTETGWEISGEKIFISGGDQNISENILHLVLARTSDEGVKGLSLFLAGSQRVNGARNTVSVTRIEEKMGLHASPTCQLAFDAAEGELIGKEGQGLRAMFTMMNHARLDVALQGVAHAARAFDVSQAYARERVQGRRTDGSPAHLVDHPDVDRMIADIDTLTIGARALAHVAFVTMERGDTPELVEALTPVAKVFCTEAGIRASETAMQVLGGYGYLREYRLEQTYRDARVTAIYEGANGIHARALVSRLLSSAPGDALTEWLLESARIHGDRRLSDCVAKWLKAKAIVLNASNSACLATDFTALTAATALQGIWRNVERNAQKHRDPERMIKRAKYAKAQGDLNIAHLYQKIETFATAASPSSVL